MIKKISRYLRKEDRIIDIGAGTGNICELLTREQFQITPLDVKNLSFVKSVKPVIYNGNEIPFPDNDFDVSLLLTVLHHTPFPEKLVAEAVRVSRRIIIIEDIYTNKLHKYITYFIDSLLNFEFIGHPHTNKSDREWKALFTRLGLKLKKVEYIRSFLVFKQAIYYLEKNS
ncbi:MAG: class I SAM-dependent methyltransferase [bacterium]